MEMLIESTKVSVEIADLRTQIRSPASRILIKSTKHHTLMSPHISHKMNMVS